MRLVLFLIIIGAVVQSNAQSTLHMDLSDLKWGKLDSVWINDNYVEFDEDKATSCIMIDTCILIRVKTSKGEFEFRIGIVKKCKDYFLSLGKELRYMVYSVEMCGAYAIIGRKRLKDILIE